MLGWIYCVRLGNLHPHGALGRTRACSHRGSGECVGAGALGFLSLVINGKKYSVGLEGSRKAPSPETSSLCLSLTTFYSIHGG